MTRKKLLLTALTVVIGIVLGVGGTIAAQTFIFKKPAVAVSSQPKPKKDGPVVPIGEFIVNLQHGSILKTSIAVEGVDTKAGETLKTKDAFLKDRVNLVLSDKSLADVQTPEAREKLKQELIVKLNEVAEDKIQDVLFQSFVYQ
ncbi:flagellar basal body-associated FliL family protein [Paradesulfitobacterium aromaticivorans]